MSEKAKPKLSTEPYKGVRDFYPEDMSIQKYIFDVMRKTVESFGYVEYGASILEPSELYRAKTGEEIVNEQTYSFIDRGDRDVTIRPEMTPTVARMVAGRRRELGFPLRWYSIPNLFRYEQPQRGRLREHWQLNVDLFGSNNIEADVEIISVACTLIKNFGAKDSEFKVLINNRKFLNFLLNDYLKLSPGESHKFSKLIDRKNKLDPKDFEKEVVAIIGDKAPQFNTLWQTPISDLPEEITSTDGYRELVGLEAALKAKGFMNIIIDRDLVRGFDYYTGTIFELFDTNPQNKRALFGGGRYDDLTSLFGGDKIPAVGFGMGDVTIRDFLETYGRLPTYRSSTDLYICVLDDKSQTAAQDLGSSLRNQGLNVAVDVSGKKLGDQIKVADKQHVPYVICVGEEEITTKQYSLKNLATGEETKLSLEQVAAFIKKE